MYAARGNFWSLHCRDAENTAAIRENNIGTQVLEAAINVHRELGPWLLETVYEVILAREMSDLSASASLREKHPLKTATDPKRHPRSR
jgi:hypothetical protein